MADDYSDVMRTYEQLKGMGLKGEADKVMQGIAERYPEGSSAPPPEIKKGLEGILATHDAAKGGKTPTRAQYAAGLVATLMAIGMMSAGLPPYMP